LAANPRKNNRGYEEEHAKGANGPLGSKLLIPVCALHPLPVFQRNVKTLVYAVTI